MFCTAGKRIKFATNPKQHCPPHLVTPEMLHYLGKLKIQIFCRHLADMKENANKLHFYRL